ncbi:hypothetical protein [Streptomyces roseolus]|uniref:hypothetical protein n=1 Tax=Streptomyces roseolus TaxID=67358 RepID=UPI001E35CCC2|nr:hypothetical protein [Streptomyces roseolus]
MKTRDTASAGYRRALEARHVAVDPDHPRPATAGVGDLSLIPAEARAAFAQVRSQEHETLMTLFENRFCPHFSEPLSPSSTG